MQPIFWRIFVSVLISALLVGCGGSNGSPSSTSNVYVAGVVNRGLWSTATPNVQVQHASVIVATTNLNGPAITSANVAINGIALLYNASINRFEGIVVPDVAGKFNLTVIANGETHTAIAAAMTSSPVVTIPSPYNATQANTISWTAPGGVVAGVSPLNYYVEVHVVNNSSLLPIAYTAHETAASTVVPANSTISATQYYITVYADYAATWIVSAASGSVFAISASSNSNLAYFTPQ